MRGRARHGATLGILALLVVLAAISGWAMLTHPFPKKADAPVCSAASVHAGEHLYPAQVTVSVLNASRRVGLAGRTLGALTADGFAAGHSGNATTGTRVDTAQIWTPEPGSPAVQLVAAWLPGAQIVLKSVTEPGVLVVVGPQFTTVGGGPSWITATSDATICSPTLS
ncbi:MAG TPA: LytR C-terminal domain-containing protein [Marmoricola sp.]|nr:LytR C-terminal domain-containing protein [Marmoricola sp.]